jgi:hypothetical protein
MNGLQLIFRDQVVVHAHSSFEAELESLLEAMDGFDHDVWTCKTYDGGRAWFRPADVLVINQGTIS